LTAKQGFYLGRKFDLKTGKRGVEEVLYDPGDLTTHAAVIGMTGSGKTGLCIDLLEEAALHGLPAILVDPKGDLANLLLHFPQLRPADFGPWIMADQAQREGKSVDELATEVAQTWRDGLADWGIEPSRVAEVAVAVEYAVYTPGAETGRPVNILTSLAAPAGDWAQAADRARDRIATTATALLGLVGVSGDPVQSREHILLANLIEASWRQGQDLNLVELIRQVRNPPLERLGALELEEFFPEADRFELATLLNNLLASPSFAAWALGEPLDVHHMLWTAEGKPRHSVFYLAHLADSERMFFVTLLLGALEAWVRGQPGATTLRALFYMDEVFGYLPPTAAPPSKAPLLRLLKQARAFGLGLVLATQNPVDLDYKALGNAGTWFVGRLQTEQDKNRLLDGLEGISAGAAGFNRKTMDAAISQLGKRVFLLHNVHQPAPVIFQTRWAMAYLAGPLTLAQVGRINEMVGAAAPIGPQQVAENQVQPGLAASRPAVPTGVGERFLMPGGAEAAQAGDGLVYRAGLGALADVRFLDRKAGVDLITPVVTFVPEPDARGMIRWDEAVALDLAPDDLLAGPVSAALYAAVQAPLNDAKRMKQLEKDFADYLYRASELRLASNETLGLVAEPGESDEAFHQRCLQEATARRDEEAEQERRDYQKKIERMKEKLTKEQRELAEDMSEHASRRAEEWVTHAENLLGLFSGSRSRRRLSTSLSKRRMTSKAQADIAESQADIEAFRKELEALEAEMADRLEELDDHWIDLAGEISHKVVTPRRQDVQLRFFGVLWMPYRRQNGQREVALFPGAN
jgi:hypothetical protein